MMRTLLRGQFHLTSPNQYLLGSRAATSSSGTGTLQDTVSSTRILVMFSSARECSRVWTRFSTSVSLYPVVKTHTSLCACTVPVTASFGRMKPLFASGYLGAALV